MNHGGARPGAGRKSDADIQKARHLIDQAVSDADWVSIFQSLAIVAIEGNVKAAELLMRYKFGQPVQPLDIEGDAQLVHITIDL